MDMWVFNIRGNTDQSEFETFYKGVIDLLAQLNGTGAHDRRHIDGIEELEDIIRETCAYYLDDKGKSYKVPSSRMLAYQISPNHEHRTMATMFTGKLVNIRNLVGEAKFDTQTVSHILPWNAAFYAVVGLNDKAGIPVGQKVAFSATQCQSGRTIIVRKRNETVAGDDHDFKCDKVVASVIHRLHIVNNVEESQYYSGGPEENGIIAVALHDSTLEPSDFYTHNACVLNDMEALAVAEMNRYAQWLLRIYRRRRNWKQIDWKTLRMTSLDPMSYHQGGLSDESTYRTVSS
eukprot:scaffold141169_cov34-Attheya_sp.AAC.1